MFAGRLSPSIGPVGVDFGMRSVKLLQVRDHGGDLRVVGAGRIDEPPYGTEPRQRRALAEQLRAALASGGFVGRRCVVGLPRRDVLMQSVRLPKMPDDELAVAATFEAAQRFELQRTAMEVDVIRTGAAPQGSDERDEILLIAAAHDRIARVVEPLLDAGLRPIAIETGFTALARAMGRWSTSASGQHEARAAVDVGAGGSTVVITRDDRLAFCKAIDVGGQQFDEAVAEHLQMDIASARELRAARIAAASGQRDDRTATDPSIDRAVYEAVRPLLGAFAKEVLLCLSYYGVAFRGHPPERVILSGGDGLEPKLAGTVARQCKVTVDLDDDVSPVPGMSRAIGEALDRPGGPAAWWTVAAGLSLRGLRGRRLAVGSGKEAA